MSQAYIEESPTRSDVLYDYDAHLFNFINVGTENYWSIHDLPPNWEKKSGAKGARFIHALLEIEGIYSALISEHSLEISRKPDADWEDILWRVRHAMEEIYKVEVREASLLTRLGFMLERRIIDLMSE